MSLRFIVGTDHDGTPMMTIVAETAIEQRMLGEVRAGLEKAQLQAVQIGKAGRFNTCGSDGDCEGNVFKITLRLALGGNVEVRYVPDPSDLNNDPIPWSGTGAANFHCHDTCVDGNDHNIVPSATPTMPHFCTKCGRPLAEEPVPMPEAELCDEAGTHIPIPWHGPDKCNPYLLDLCWRGEKHTIIPNGERGQMCSRCLRLLDNVPTVTEAIPWTGTLLGQPTCLDPCPTHYDGVHTIADSADGYICQHCHRLLADKPSDEQSTPPSHMAPFPDRSKR